MDISFEIRTGKSMIVNIQSVPVKIRVCIFRLLRGSGDITLNFELLISDCLIVLLSHIFSGKKDIFFSAKHVNKKLVAI